MVRAAAAASARTATYDNLPMGMGVYKNGSRGGGGGANGDDIYLGSKGDALSYLARITNAELASK